MIKTFKIVFCASVAFSCTSKAALIALSGSSIFLSDQSTLVPQNSLISVGYFSDTFSDFGGLSSRSWADITATDFSEISSGLINPAGEWAGGSDEDGILGEKLYVWVFDSLSLPTFVNDVEFGLYTGSSADWTGKADNTGVPPITNVLSINSVDSVIYGTDLGDNLALVPEPVQVTAIAGLIGLVVVLRKRKRRNS